VSDYDFIVVGGGSAGACVAARMSDGDASVLLLEAGGTELPENVDNPSLWFTLLGSPIDWGYQSVPQRGLNGRQTYEPRGKALGGSSNLYIMMHIRGHRYDYDNWAYNGCPGWSYEDCLPYLQRLEDQEDQSSPVAGHGGPVHVANAKLHGPHPTSEAFYRACVELGYPESPDFNGPEMEGVGWHHINVKDGRRHSTRAAYLEPIEGRENLTVSTGSQATRLLFKGDRCTGVEYVKDGKKHTAHAAKEVVLSCGAIESPKLLLLSGIGPAAHLREHGVDVKVDLPGVGENFHNHVLTGVIYECKQPVPPGHQNLSEVALFTRSDPGWPVPDLQIGFVHVPFNIIVGQGHPNSISILPGVVRPLSRGTIRLASSDPLEKPLVDPNYLGARSDLDRLAQAVEIAREIFATSAFSDWVGDEMMPGPDVKTDEQILAFCRDNADSYHHQAGSCRMGMDELAVVDPQLRVYGVEGLRVADASVMPAVQTGNCNTGIIMVGERCAEFVKQANGLPTAPLAMAGTA
jgi:choline dehydrogenase